MVRWRLGVTGGIGSGKSTVARRLGELGAHVIDADAAARLVCAPGGRAMPALVAQFGPDCALPDGGLNRDWMRAQTFADPGVRRILETILHPLIGQAMADEAANSASTCLVFDIPLLVESPRWRPQLDRVLVVDCDHATQVQRVQARNGWTVQQIERVIEQQADRQQRLAAADWVINNHGQDLLALANQVRVCAQRFGLSSPD